MNPVVHFEMPYEDKERMANFYSSAFGWQMQRLGSEMNDYVIATTAEMDEATHFPKKPGSINGGFFPRNEAAKVPSVVIGVEDIRDAMKKVVEAGGKLSQDMTGGEPVMIPGVGWYISFTDTEGNQVSLMQPVGM